MKAIKRSNIFNDIHFQEFDGSQDEAAMNVCVNRYSNSAHKKPLLEILRKIID